MHHNTTHETGVTLDIYKDKANDQERKILNCLKHYGRPLSPWQIHSIFERSKLNETLEITSIRRALSDMTKAGVIIKLNRKTDGPKGRKEYLWTIPKTEV